MNPDTLEILQNLFFAIAIFLGSIIIVCLLMGATKHVFKLLLVIVLLSGATLYIMNNKKELSEKYLGNSEIELVNKIISDHTKNTLKLQLPK
jgi:hypothetical protein